MRPRAAAMVAAFAAAAASARPSWVLDLRRPDPQRAMVSALSGGPALEWAGFSLASGDVNADGVVDLVVGAPGGTDDRPSRRGRIYVVFGRPQAIPALLDLAPRLAASGRAVSAAEPGEGAPHADLIIEGPSDFDHLGSALAVADLDNDGAADIVAGAPRADGPLDARGDCGEVWILYGQTSPPARVALGSAAPGGRVALVIGRSGGDALGTSIAAADVTGDGRSDLILGAPLADGRAGALGAQDSGAVVIIPGHASWPSIIDLAGPAPEGTAWLRGEDPGDQAGSSVATGDLDGDGLADVAAGARAADGPENQRPDAGEVHILFGSRAFSPAHRLVIAGRAIGDLAGSSLAAGDMNGDRIDDLAIGAPLADGPARGRLDTGEVIVLMGRPAPSFASIAAAPPAPPDLPGRPAIPEMAHSVVLKPPLIDAAAPVPGLLVVHGADPGDHTQARLVRDLDLDGRAPLPPAPPDAAGRRNGRAGGGEARIVSGAAADSREVDLRAAPVPVIYGAVGGGHFGHAVAAPDLDGDGQPELAVSAPQAGQSLAGRVFVIRGRWADLAPPAVERR